MKIRWFGAALAVAMLFGVGSAQAERRIMTWVPSYGISASLTALQKRYGAAVSPGNSITHVALQFWVPTANGKGIQYSTDGNPDDAAVAQFVQWGHQHGIKVLLCIYNDVPHTMNPPGNYSWDWAYAKNSFSTNRGKFIQAVVATMRRLDLDGVDIDFEAPDQHSTGENDGDRPAFGSFLKALKAYLAVDNAELSTVSFPTIYNGPNSTWWSMILPHVDGLTSMGYQDIGRNGAAGTWQRYSQQKLHAGRYAAKLQLGMPSNFDTWLGNNAQQQIAWVAQAGDVGIGIWDAQLTATAWQQPALWRALNELRHEPAAP